MKKMSILFLVSAFVCTTAFADYDCQVSSNGIGDWRLVTIGGFTFAKPISIDLYPTNAPLRDTAYPIRCQVIYKDNQIVRPMSDDELEIIRRTGETLNSWLVEFIVADYIMRICVETIIVESSQKKSTAYSRNMLPTRLPPWTQSNALTLIRLQLQ